MPKAKPAASLGEFELLVLLAVARLEGRAYPLAIRDEIEARTKRRVSRPAVFITLERLEDKGLLSSYYGDPTPVRGGVRNGSSIPRRPVSRLSSSRSAMSPP